MLYPEFQPTPLPSFVRGRARTLFETIALLSGQINQLLYVAEITYFISNKYDKIIQLSPAYEDTNRQIIEKGFAGLVETLNELCRTFEKYNLMPFHALEEDALLSVQNFYSTRVDGVDDRIKVGQRTFFPIGQFENRGVTCAILGFARRLIYLVCEITNTPIRATDIDWSDRLSVFKSEVVYALKKVYDLPFWWGMPAALRHDAIAYAIISDPLASFDELSEDDTFAGLLAAAVETINPTPLAAMSDWLEENSHYYAAPIALPVVQWMLERKLAFRRYESTKQLLPEGESLVSYYDLVEIGGKCSDWFQLKMTEALLYACGRYHSRQLVKTSRTGKRYRHAGTHNADYGLYIERSFPGKLKDSYQAFSSEECEILNVVIELEETIRSKTGKIIAITREMLLNPSPSSPIGIFAPQSKVQYSNSLLPAIFRKESPNDEFPTVIWVAKQGFYPTDYELSRENGWRQVESRSRGR